MRKRVFLNVALLSVALLASRNEGALAVNTGSPSSFRYDERLVSDSINFHLNDISSSQSWIVAKVEPDKDSPSDRDVGVHFDKNGHLVIEPDTRIRTIRTVSGILHPTLNLSGKAQLPTSYHWEYEENVRVPDISEEEERYPIFLSGSGGTALFRINEATTGKNEFQPAYLLTDEWVPFVQPAFKYAQAHKEAFDPDNVSEYREQLQQLLLDPNPFLAIAAARTLGEAHQLDAAFVQGPLTQTKGLEQSVFAFLFIQQLPRDKRLDLGDEQVTPKKLNDAVAKAISGETPTENLAAFIDSARDAETLKAITVGLAALLDSRDSSIFTEARVEGLLHHVIGRQKTLNTHTEADAYLNASPVLMNLRQPLNAVKAPK